MLGTVEPALIADLVWLELTVEIVTKDEQWVRSLTGYGQEIGAN